MVNGLTSNHSNVTEINRSVMNRRQIQEQGEGQKQCKNVCLTNPDIIAKPGEILL